MKEFVFVWLLPLIVVPLLLLSLIGLWAIIVIIVKEALQRLRKGKQNDRIL